MAWVLLTGAAAICLPEKKAKKKDNATQEPRGRDNAPASAEAVRKIRSALSITIALSHLANIGLVAADDGAVEYVGARRAAALVTCVHRAGVVHP